MANILLVTMGGQGTALSSILEKERHGVRKAAGFAEAMAYLAEHSPELLIAELQLGPFNALHLVLRHQISHPAMRSIILSRAYDPVLAADAGGCGAVYVTEPIDDDRLIELVARTLQPANPKRRWPRKKPSGTLVVRMGAHQARVLDVSYGGLRLEAADASELPSRLQIVFADSGVSVEARPIWSQRAPHGSWWYGADVSELGAGHEEAWRRLVDSVVTS
jgi:DNA-binding NtrC family response regulator